MEYLKEIIKELATNSINKNITDLSIGINEFNRGYTLRNNLVTNEYSDVFDLYSVPSIIRIIKSRRMRWAGLVA
jgi:hypothetical protein